MFCSALSGESLGVLVSRVVWHPSALLCLLDDSLFRLDAASRFVLD